MNEEMKNRNYNGRPWRGRARTGSVPYSRRDAYTRSDPSAALPAASGRSSRAGARSQAGRHRRRARGRAGRGTCVPVDCTTSLADRSPSSRDRRPRRASALSRLPKAPSCRKWPRASCTCGSGGSGSAAASFAIGSSSPVGCRPATRDSSGECLTGQQAFHFDQRAALADIVQLAGRGPGQIDQAPGMEGAAIVDADHHRPAVGRIADAHIARGSAASDVPRSCRTCRRARRWRFSGRETCARTSCRCRAR